MIQDRMNGEVINGSHPHDDALLINNTDRADSFEEDFGNQEVILQEIQGTEMPQAKNLNEVANMHKKGLKMSAISEVTHDSRTMSEFSRTFNNTTITPVSNAGSTSGYKLAQVASSVESQQNNIEFNEQRQPSVSLEAQGQDNSKFFITMNIDKIEEENESSNHFETQGSNSARQSELKSARQSEFGNVSPSK